MLGNTAPTQSVHPGKQIQLVYPDLNHFDRDDRSLGFSGRRVLIDFVEVAIRLARFAG